MEYPDVPNRAVLVHRVIKCLWATYQNFLAEGKIEEGKGVEKALNDFIENITKYY